jgi:hypothetical protein
VGSNLDSGEAERLDLAETFCRKRRVLHRHHPDTDEMTRMRAAKRRDSLIDVTTERIRVRSRKPVRQQFRHRRNHLHIDIVDRHVVYAAACVPASGIDDAKHLSADHHCGGAIAAPQLDRRP